MQRCTLTSLLTFQAKIQEISRLKNEDIDRAFIAANFEDEKSKEMDINPDRDLCRYEFMEVLVRLADMKFHRESGPRSYVEHLGDFLGAVLSQCHSSEYILGTYRKLKVWSLGVDDCLRKNLEGL